MKLNSTDNSYGSSMGMVANATVDSEPWVSDHVQLIFQHINYAVLIQIVAIVGLVTNVINMVVFLKIGFKDTVNISLFALSISDFLSCLFMMGTNIALSPWFLELDLPIQKFHIQYVICAIPNVMCSRITSIITAFVTFERCVCVVLPLKVKILITHRRVVVFNISAYVFTIILYTPLFLVQGYEWVFDPELNKTLLTLVYKENRAEVSGIILALGNAVLPLFIFMCITVCTIVLVSKLMEKAKWREAATSSKGTGDSSKEKRISRMIATVSTVFIICYFPVMIATILMISIPEFTVLGEQQNALFLLWSFVYVFATTNSSVNIFVYYSKSTTYRSTFDRLFGRSTPQSSG